MQRRRSVVARTRRRCALAGAIAAAPAASESNRRRESEGSDGRSTPVAARTRSRMLSQNHLVLLPAGVSSSSVSEGLRKRDDRPNTASLCRWGSVKITGEGTSLELSDDDRSNTTWIVHVADRSVEDSGAASSSCRVVSDHNSDESHCVSSDDCVLINVGAAKDVFESGRSFLFEANAKRSRLQSDDACLESPPPGEGVPVFEKPIVDRSADAETNPSRRMSKPNTCSGSAKDDSDGEKTFPSFSSHLSSSSSSETDGEKNEDSGRRTLGKSARSNVLDAEGRVQGKATTVPIKTSPATKPQDLRFGKSKKRKREQTLKGDSLRGNVGNLLDELLPETGTFPHGHPTTKNNESLPLIFSFGDDNLEPAEKPEYERKLDELWAEFDFVLHSNDIGSYSPYKNEHKEAEEPEGGRGHPFPLCNGGGHQLILDEQIGIRCSQCPDVKLEIKYILPSLAADRRSGGPSGQPIMGVRRENRPPPLPDDFLGSRSPPGFEVNPEGATVWDVIPGVKSTLYAHQQEAFEFLWRNMAGDLSLESVKKNDSATATVSGDGGASGGCMISHAPGTGKTRLAIVFLHSFLRVFPESRPVVIAPRGMLLTWSMEFQKWKVNIPVHLLNEAPLSGRREALDRWASGGGGVLLVSYCLFAKLAGGGRWGKLLLQRPSLLVLDEGHTARNDQSRLWQALRLVETRRRVILSGTPFQNNFGELYNTLRLVRPFFSGDRWAALTSDVAISGEALEQLRSMMRPFVHVHGGSGSLKSLPGLRDCLVVLDPPPAQREAMRAAEEEGGRGASSFAAEYRGALAAVHPSLVAEGDGGLDPGEGVKTRFVAELVRLCGAVGERVLVFAQYLEPLQLIMRQMAAIFGWKEGKEVLRMDGKMGSGHRQAVIERFNNEESSARLLLASTRACSEGISLTGASRVVLLDVVWNPAVERQAVSRAHRLGQERVVYVYHLITAGSREGDKYLRQVEKDRLSRLVFSPEADRSSSGDGEEEEEDKVLKEMAGHDRFKGVFKRILYHPKESDSVNAYAF
ncbi:unnamed protein product [Spirodela intermedia]|uniref:Uncharacterized protein n=1 Tax=Spirodela intermedia TaxID=51605 RepID=A0A7I8LAE9_SPIIN|nr:unnamed protein product [Spirodela intermedia]